MVGIWESVVSYSDSMDMNLTDLFLNEEPFDPLSPLIESPSDERVEERIRQLQGVTVRTGQRKRQRCERSSVGISLVYSDILVNADVDRGIPDKIDGEKNKERGCKRDSSNLVGKALESALAMDSPAKERVKEGGSFYDCNICFELARDPVLTCCGHLFCWACFYQVGYVDTSSKECPVCKGDIFDGNVTPIYGNVGSESECETVSDLKLPPRPKACRVERVRRSD